jgi:hypothetical protein
LFIYRRIRFSRTGQALALGAVTPDALSALGRRSLRQPGSLPRPGLPPGTDLLPGIDHIVILMLENHSFDNIFGMLGRVDGFKLDRHGRPTATTPIPTAASSTRSACRPPANSRPDPARSGPRGRGRSGRRRGGDVLVAKDHVIFVSRCGAIEIQEKDRGDVMGSEIPFADRRDWVIFEKRDAEGDCVWEEKNRT